VILSKTTGYGIRALAYLAGRERAAVCGLQEIADSENIPPVYLRKILGELRRQRILRSVKGVHGGYILAREPETITLWEVNTILAPDPYFDECLLGDGDCGPPHSCVLHEEWDEIRRIFVDFLKAKTIAEIARTMNKEIPAAGISAEIVAEENHTMEGKL